MTEPEAPIAGRETEFTIVNLQPWQRVEITMLNPSRRPANWISVRDFVWEDTSRVLFADESGMLRWSRQGLADRPGRWIVRAETQEDAFTFDFLLSELALGDLESFFMGSPLRGYHGEQASIFFSDQVPASLAVDLQDHLALVAGVLEEALGAEASEVPDLYIVGDQFQFEHTSQSTGIDPGWEAGYFKASGVRPGIYMMRRNTSTRLRLVVTHEYVHLVVNEITPNRWIPPWLNEGLARYYEFEVGLDPPRPDATSKRRFWSADLAREAALEDRLFPLRRLENQRTWNNREDEDEIDLQYEQSHMAVRYLIETYGDQAPVEIINELGSDTSIRTAMKSVIGVDYQQFERDFVAWLKEWEDPKRAEARPYLDVLDGILGSLEALRERRELILKELRENYDRTLAMESYSSFLSETDRLMGLMESNSPPERYQNLHSLGNATLSIRRDWYDAALQGHTSRSGIANANALIPEVDARHSSFHRAVFDAKAALNLFDD